ncbi:MAG TPA: hypothetical protein VG276_06465 [Actinomycetes bacterium]|jgi:hypothetical protein|nr:hypothetical protein [Actinomycetes bacterium]
MLSPTPVVEMPTARPARRYDSPSRMTAATASRRTSRASGFQNTPVDSIPTTLTRWLASQSPSNTSPAVVVRNVRVSLRRSPGRSAGTRTHAVTDALCTSSPAQRSMSLSTPSSSLDGQRRQGEPHRERV